MNKGQAVVGGDHGVRLELLEVEGFLRAFTSTVSGVYLERLEYSTNLV